MKEDIFLKNSIGLLILAGGKSQRMGRDKGTLKIGEETFIMRLLENMGDYDERIVSSSRKLYEEWDVTLADEAGTEGKGPAAGIVTALTYCKSDSLMVVPCDVPFADFSVAKKLAEVYLSLPEKLKKPVVSESTNGIEPLVGIYPKAVLPIMRKAIDEGIYSVKDILKRIGYREVPIADEKLININTPEDYEKYE